MRGVQNSLSLAAVAAVIGLLVGFAAAYLLTYSRFKLKRLIDLLTLTAMAVPGVVLGIGYIFVWNQKWLASRGIKPVRQTGNSGSGQRGLRGSAD